MSVNHLVRGKASTHLTESVRNEVFHVSSKGYSWGETRSRKELVFPTQGGKIRVFPFTSSFVEECPSFLKMHTEELRGEAS